MTADTRFNEQAMTAAMVSVKRERRAQHAKWGRQRLDWPLWLSILAEELGEAAREANQAHWGPSTRTAAEYAQQLIALRKELIQTAAVAVAIIEHINEVFCHD